MMVVSTLVENRCFNCFTYEIDLERTTLSFVTGLVEQTILLKPNSS